MSLVLLCFQINELFLNNSFHREVVDITAKSIGCFPFDHWIVMLLLSTFTIKILLDHVSSTKSIISTSFIRLSDWLQLLSFLSLIIWKLLFKKKSLKAEVFGYKIIKAWLTILLVSLWHIYKISFLSNFFLQIWYWFGILLLHEGRVKVMHLLVLLPVLFRYFAFCQKIVAFKK